MAKTAMNNPKAVVIRAWKIPVAAILALMVSACAMDMNAEIIPVTVPRKPVIGAMVAMAERNIRLRLVSPAVFEATAVHFRSADTGSVFSNAALKAGTQRRFFFSPSRISFPEAGSAQILSARSPVLRFTDAKKKRRSRVTARTITEKRARGHITGPPMIKKSISETVSFIYSPKISYIKKLAKTSSNPGKTQTLNLFLINNKYYFIDVPGYGYANVSKSIKATFGKMIEEYVCKRENLKMVCLLVDFRHKPTEDDCLMYEFLKHYNRPVTVIATKSDKVKNSERSKNKKQIIETLNLTEGDKLIITSSEKREGFGLVMQMLDDVVGKHDEYLASLTEEEIIEE